MMYRHRHTCNCERLLVMRKAFVGNREHDLFGVCVCIAMSFIWGGVMKHGADASEIVKVWENKYDAPISAGISGQTKGTGPFN